MGSRFEHTLKLTFRRNAKLPSFSGAVYAPPPTRGFDRLTITQHAIEFSFARSTRLKAENALTNATRLDQIRRALLYVSATATTIPELQSIEYQDRLETQAIELPLVMRGWYAGPNKPLVREETAARVFSNEPVDKAISRSLTYLCASRRMAEVASQNDRLRYLWSGFNALYNYLGSEAGVTKEGQCIACARDYLDTHCETERLLERYRNCDSQFMLKRLHYYVYLNRRIMTRKGALRDDWQVLLQCMDATLLANSKSVFTKLTENNSQKLATYEALQSQATEDELAQVLFLVCQYAYSLRNAFFHGESYYPLFVVKEDELLELTADLLELACLAIIEQLAKDGA